MTIFFLVYGNLFVGEEPFLQDALNEEIQRELNEELEKIPLPPGPNRLPPRQVTNSVSGSFTSQKSSNSLTERRFNLQQVEMWIVLSSLLGAVLALIGKIIFHHYHKTSADFVFFLPRVECYPLQRLLEGFELWQTNVYI